MKLKFRYGIFNYLGIVIYLAIIAGLGYWISTIFLGNYILAWYITVATSFSALLFASLPRSVVVTDSMIELRCLLEVRIFARGAIKSIRKVSPRELQPVIPLAALFGFIGYVGMFFVPKRLRVAKLYLTQYRYLVEIVMNSGRVYYLSLPERDKLFISPRP